MSHINPHHMYTRHACTCMQYHTCQSQRCSAEKEWTSQQWQHNSQSLQILLAFKHTLAYLHYTFSDDFILHIKVDGYPSAPLILFCRNELYPNAIGEKCATIRIECSANHSKWTRLTHHWGKNIALPSSFLSGHGTKGLLHLLPQLILRNANCRSSSHFVSTFGGFRDQHSWR